VEHGERSKVEGGWMSLVERAELCCLNSLCAMLVDSVKSFELRNQFSSCGLRDHFLPKVADQTGLCPPQLIHRRKHCPLKRRFKIWRDTMVQYQRLATCFVLPGYSSGHSCHQKRDVMQHQSSKIIFLVDYERRWPNPHLPQPRLVV